MLDGLNLLGEFNSQLGRKLFELSYPDYQKMYSLYVVFSILFLKLEKTFKYTNVFRRF